MKPPERHPQRLFAPPRVQVSDLPDGSRLLESPDPLGPHARAVGEWLEHWAAVSPDAPFLSERAGRDQGWRTVPYAQALQRVQAMATWMLDAGLSAERPLVILCDNGIDHGLLMLAAQHVGIPVVPVSVAYSLASNDHAKLRGIIELVTPGAIVVGDAQAYAKALEAIRQLHTARVVSVDSQELISRTDAGRVARAFSQVGPQTVAKILFTSGSTGTPKGVINTQRMLCASQQAKAQVWPFLTRTPPVIVDWLPWSHTFGGNHNFYLVLRHGGHLCVDAGKPAPGLVDTTLANIRSIPPTVYFNVPRGFDLLVQALRQDVELRERFFSRLQAIFYAAAALPQPLWEALTELAVQTIGEPIALVSAWGSTETSPLATDCHFQAERAGVIGLPVPGTVLRLVPQAGKLEIRVRGPNVMPGYWRRPELTAPAFDEQGFYRIGDAVRFVDPQRPEAGLMFDGRIAEDFKLSSGTWVSVGALRVRAVEWLMPVAQDVVVSGHDRDEVAFLVVPNLPACRALSGFPADAPIGEVLLSARVREALRAGLQRLKDEAQGASSLHARRALLLEAPLSIDAGEITDKGYVNQRAVLNHRADLVELLHQPVRADALADPRLLVL
ncbi:MAG: feruloyl-CoA synthase [Burkholderiaceae bacterium]